MDAKELLLTRRSIRSFKDEVVSKEVMNEILDLTRYAPSWTNSQTARYTLINNKDIINKIADECVKGFIYNAETLKQAKNICVISYVAGKSGSLQKIGSNDGNTNKWEVFDSGIATLQFCLAAHEKNVGTVIMGIIDEDKIAKVIDLPEGEKVSVLIVYGYANGDHPQAPLRKDIEIISRFL